MSERYAEIVLQDDIDASAGVCEINSADATRYENLRSIALPANGGNMDWTQTIVLTRQNGSVERVQGHLIDSGVVAE